MKQLTMVEEFTSTSEGMAEFQQERVILDVTQMIRRIMKDQEITKADLAVRLHRSKAYITQLLDGRTNMTLRTISDVLCALDRCFDVSDTPLRVVREERDGKTILAHPDKQMIFTASGLKNEAQPVLNNGFSAITRHPECTQFPRMAS